MGPLVSPQGDRIGYARVSTQEQILDLQRTALNNAGCVNIYDEKVSASGKQKRPKLDLAIKELRPGDTLVVWRLDRLARSQKEFYIRMEQIEAAGAKFKSLTEDFDFGHFMGKFVLGILALTAELERQLTIHRTHAGLDEARRRGQKLGAARKINDAKKRAIKADLKADKLSVKAVAEKHGVAASTIYYLFKGGRRGAQGRKTKKRNR